MNREKATQALYSTLREVAPDVDIHAVPPDADLREELELDSLDFLRVVEILAERTGVRIDEEDYPRLKSLNSATEWLSSMSMEGTR